MKTVSQTAESGFRWRHRWPTLPRLPIISITGVLVVTRRRALLADGTPNASFDRAKLQKCAASDAALYCP
jgi:hypothetical protein